MAQRDHQRDHVRRERGVAAAVSKELAALDHMTGSELATKFREVFGVPTRTRNKAYLLKRLAWRLQELAMGGLPETALGRIEQLAPLAPVHWQPRAVAQAPRAGQGRPGRLRDPRLPPPGTVLTRLHDGVEHKVVVRGDGFEYQGTCYRSLSKIARLITGTAWNGHLFFRTQQRGPKVAAPVSVPA